MVRIPFNLSVPRRQLGDSRYYCSTCGHDATFHQLITRDKWEIFDIADSPVNTGRIPWICEYFDERTEDLCGCSNLIPVTKEELMSR